MRLPYLQLDADFINQRAKDVSTLLGCPRSKAIGHLSLLWAWALSRGSDDAPPTGLVTGQHAVRLIESAAEWDGQPGALFEALTDADVNLLEKTTDGIRIRGMDRYTKAWDKQRKDRERKSDVRRKSGGHPMDGARQTQTQTQTQKEKTAGEAVAPPASEERADEQSVTEPTDLEVEAAIERLGEREVLELRPTEAVPKERPKAPALALYDNLEASRAQQCKDKGVPFVPSRWDFGRQQKQLGPVAKSTPEERERFEAAWGAYCEDPIALDREPAFSLEWFLKSRSRYEGRALKAAGGVA